MISLILIALAAMFNACMDTTEFHYSNSIFTKFNNAWYFDASISWKNKYIGRVVENGIRKWFFNLLDLPVFLTDFWHLCKSLMIIFLCASIVAYSPMLGKYITEVKLIQILVDFSFLGTVWNCTFSLFFNHFLLNK